MAAIAATSTPTPDEPITARLLLDQLVTLPGAETVTRLINRARPARIALAAATASYIGFFWVHLYWRHSRFGTFDYDLGIWDQYAWGLANGETFNTIRGLDAWAFHVSPGMALFAPAYWLGAGSGFLNYTMVVAVAVGVIPIYRVAHRHLESEWLPTILGVAYLAHFSTQWSLWETFHPEVMAMAPLLFAWDAADRRAWTPMYLWLFGALIWKEDVSLAVAAFGLMLALRKHWRVALTTVVLGMTWFVASYQIIIPARAPEGAVFYEEFYGHLGESPIDMVDTAATNPTAFTRQLDEANAVGYVRDLGLGYGFASFLSPAPLLVGLPQTAANLLSSVSNSWPTRVHYAAIPVAALSMAMVEAVAGIRRRNARLVLVGWIGACALATSAAWGISMFSVEYRDGFWPLDKSPAVAEVQGAIDVTPGDVAVAGTYNVVPHLTHRSDIYTFPNPWRPGNWGIANEDPPDPDIVTWMVIDRRVMDGPAIEFMNEILADGWVVVYDEGVALVATRDPAVVGADEGADP